MHSPISRLRRVRYRRFASLISFAIICTTSAIGSPPIATAATSGAESEPTSSVQVDQLAAQSAALTASSPALQLTARDAATGQLVDSAVRYEVYAFNPGSSPATDGGTLIAASDSQRGSATMLPTRSALSSSLVDADGRLFVTVMARSEGKIGFSVETLFDAGTPARALWTTEADPAVRAEIAALSTNKFPALLSSKTDADITAAASRVSMSPKDLRAAVLPRFDVAMTDFGSPATGKGFGGVTNFPASCDFLYDKGTTNHNNTWTTILNVKSNGHTNTSYNVSTSSTTKISAGYSLAGSSSGFNVSGSTSHTRSYGFGADPVSASSSYAIQLRGDYRTKKWQCVPTSPTQAPYYIWERYLYTWDDGQIQAPTTTTQPPSCGTYINWSGGFKFVSKDISSEKSGGAGVTISGLTLAGNTTHTSSTNITFRENGGTIGGGICNNWQTAKFVAIR